MNRILAAAFLTISALSPACSFQAYNSSTTDPDRYGGGVVDDGTPGGQRFSAAYNLLRERCFACHLHGFNSLTTQQQFIDTGYIVPNNPAGSDLYKSLKGTGLPDGRQDMPQDSTLSATELATIRDWIQQVGL